MKISTLSLALSLYSIASKIKIPFFSAFFAFLWFLEFLDIILHLSHTEGRIMEVRSPSRLFEEATVHEIHDRSYDIIVVTSESLRGVPVKKRSLVRTVLDTLGEGSAKAQKLPSVITTMGKVLEANPPQYIYLCVDRTRVLGFLKFGKKHLFITNPNGKWLENDFDCLLDFYVHESCQRQGIGYLLFSNMLLHQELEPRSLAYDRPSSKLIPFLRRHCNLRSFTPQNNNYVVFDSYYKDNSPKSQQSQRHNDSIDHIMNQSSFSGNQSSSSVKKTTYVDSRGISGRGSGRTRKKDYFTSSSTAQQRTLQQQRDIKSTPYSAPITTTSEMDSASAIQSGQHVDSTTKWFV